MEKVMQRYEKLTKLQKRIVDNLILSGSGFDKDKHIPVFVQFPRKNNSNSDKRYIYYVLLEEVTLLVNDEKELIGEYVVVPVGYGEENNFAVATITHTIETITKNNFDADIIIEHMEKEFVVRPILTAIGKIDEEDTLVGAYAAESKKSSRKEKLRVLIEKEAKIAEENKRLSILSSYNPALQSLLDEYSSL